MGTGASIHTSNFLSNGHELYGFFDKLVKIEEELLRAAREDSADGAQCGGTFIAQAKELDQTAQSLEFTVNLEEIIENEKQILLNYEEEKILTPAKAKLYCVAALLEYQAVNLLNRAIPFIEQMLAKNIEILSILKEVYENQNTTEESRESAYSKFVDLAFDPAVHDDAQKQAKHFQTYGVLCRKKSKIVFMCANNPAQFEPSSNELKDINSLFNIPA